MTLYLHNKTVPGAGATSSGTTQREPSLPRAVKGVASGAPAGGIGDGADGADGWLPEAEFDLFDWFAFGLGEDFCAHGLADPTPAPWVVRSAPRGVNPFLGRAG